ncbi:MAG: hypothetical protein AB8F95_08645 [Bacteroidia bacterium]
MRHFIFIITLLCSIAYSQERITFDWLQTQVRMVEAFDLGTRSKVQKPRFEKALRKLDGKEVILKGYMLPLDVDGQSYALSANPYAACFFCGGAGVETVIGIWFDGPPPRRYKTDAVVVLRGTLVLSEIPGGYVYLLQEVKEVR